MPDAQRETTAAEARQLWATLASEGKPPGGIADARNTLPRYSVGVGGWLDRLAARYLRDLCRSTAHFKLALAPNGGGKTHFLLELGARALHENFAASYIACGPGVSVENPLDLYRETVRRLSLPGSSTAGLPSLLDRVLQTKRREIEKQEAPDAELALDRWIASVRKTRYPEPAFGRVLAAALRDVKDNAASPADDAAMRWLDGEIATLDRQDLSALKLSRIAAGDRKRFGRDMLWSLIRFAPQAGVYGVALLLDEVETLTTVRGKALQRVLAAMRVLVDGSKTEGGIPLFGVFAATPDILDQLPAYPALQQRLAELGSAFHEAGESKGNDYAPQLRLAHIGDRKTLLADIGRKLIDVGRDATGHEFDNELQSANATALAAVASGRNLDIDARRLYVKTWVGLLEYQKNNGERRFPENEMSDRYTGSFENLRSADREDPEP